MSSPCVITAPNLPIYYHLCGAKSFFFISVRVYFINPYVTLAIVNDRLWIYYFIIPNTKVHGANMGLIWVLLARDGPQVGPRPQMGPRLFPWILLSVPQVGPRPQMGPRLVSWTLLSGILHDILVTGNSSPCRVRWRNNAYSDSQCCKHAKMDVNRWDWSFAVVLLACDDLTIHMIKYTKGILNLKVGHS